MDPRGTDEPLLRLKCRHLDSLRVVVIKPEMTFADLVARLEADYGFKVVLRYEDSDGDLITLSSENDLNDMLLHESGTVNVHVAPAEPARDLSASAASHLLLRSGAALLSKSTLGESRKCGHDWRPGASSSATRGRAACDS